MSRVIGPVGNESRAWSVSARSVVEVGDVLALGEHEELALR